MDDIHQAIQVFHEAIGGSKEYKNHPIEIKQICMGLKRSLIKKSLKMLQCCVLILKTLSGLTHIKSKKIIIIKQ